jgi:hypothetical protein
MIRADIMGSRWGHAELCPVINQGDPIMSAPLCPPAAILSEVRRRFAGKCRSLRELPEGDSRVSGVAFTSSPGTPGED